MVFVDSLGVMLVGLALATAIGAFYFFFAARGDYDQVRALVFPAVLVGLFDFISGFWMSFVWPFPSYVAAYNMLFGDPLLLAGLVLMVAGTMGYKDPKNMHMGVLPILILFVGIYVLVASYSIVQLNLESGSHLFTALGLYLSDGIGAVLAPLMYLKPDGSTSKLLYYIEWIIFGIGTIFALILASTALNGHLASPP